MPELVTPQIVSRQQIASIHAPESAPSQDSTYIYKSADRFKQWLIETAFHGLFYLRNPEALPRKTVWRHLPFDFRSCTMDRVQKKNDQKRFQRGQQISAKRYSSIVLVVLPITISADFDALQGFQLQVRFSRHLNLSLIQMTNNIDAI